jgi:hypothetical protein
MPDLDRLSSRSAGIEQLRAKLLRGGFPRILMSFLVALTGGVGFLASFLLLKVGVEAMWLRYPIAVAIAYAFFLLLLDLWIRRAIHELLNLDPGVMCGPSPGSARTSDAVDIGDAVEVVGAADAFAIPLAFVLFAAALLLSSLFVIYTAPTLLAEVLFDTLLAAGLYRRLKHIDRRYWLETAVRRTIWPFALTALCLAATGWAMAHYVPGADSIGDLLTRTPPS